MTADDLILQTITPTSHDLGDFRVYRSLPVRERTMVGPFIFFDQAGPAKIGAGQGIDVRPHPHINLATVTYMYEGAFLHRDSLGTEQLIEAGAVNLMTAGKGIVHSERSPDDDRAKISKLSAIQTWLALPDRYEEMDPAFEHVGEGGMPVIDDGHVRARVIMGSLWGETSPVTTYAQTIYADIQLSPGSRIAIDPSVDERAIYVSGGDAALDGLMLAPQTLYVLRPGTTATLMSVDGGRVVLCGGEAFTSPRHVWWNFVSSTKDRLMQAREDWEAMRFPLIPGDDQEFIPIPQGRPKTVSYP
ncbi:pirin family protein [Sphingobium limneticum]|jgi:redox-sensitive bicupin YhaK (pirin superfamily)|uniref:Pirin family protein n=1 Tax=Sphingobium limneticum TaxID=1007511 RepID=A0A5J5I170_9SPHN|nr:pirin family protein [Sphingobium limneticum]KAA9015328.1 pirin family protein [Sphingobium limneticum]KAA9029292.1 pirin family protein [Sphingobium limneticum]